MTVFMGVDNALFGFPRYEKWVCPDRRTAVQEHKDDGSGVLKIFAAPEFLTVSCSK
jgi:hypothetical protein